MSISPGIVFFKNFCVAAVACFASYHATNFAFDAWYSINKYFHDRATLLIAKAIVRHETKRNCDTVTALDPNYKQVVNLVTKLFDGQVTFK